MDMPEFRDDDGALWIWDADSKSYVKSEGDDFDHPRSWSSGGDNQLFDPAVHRFTPKNPDQEGILAARFDQCPDCGSELQQGQCAHCLQNNLNGAPIQNVVYSPFTQREPKRDLDTTDDSYPSRLTYKTHDGPALTDEVAISMKRHEFSHVLDEDTYRQSNKATLDECPECSSPMTDKRGEKLCHTCGHRQPIINVEAKEKTSFLPLLAPLLEAGGAAAGAEAGGAAMGAGAEAGGASVAGGGMLGQAGPLMNQALKGNAAMNTMEKAKGMFEPNVNVHETEDPYLSHTARDDEDSDDIFSDDKNPGRDDHPEHDGTRGFQEEVSDNDEFLKDVNGDGGTLNEDDAFNPDKPRGSAEHAIRSFEQSLPLVMFYADSEESGADNPVLKALDDMLEDAFPGYKDESASSDDKPKSHEDKDDSEDKEDSDDDKKESNAFRDYPEDRGMGEPCPVCGQLGECPHKPAEGITLKPGATEHMPAAPSAQRAYASREYIAARKPHMCPYHKNLVETSIALGDPAGALNAMATHQFSDHSCQGEWKGDKSCKFKPGMITQKYWDDKKQKAEELREQRELEQAEQELYVDAQDEALAQPGDYELALDNVLDPEWTAEDAEPATDNVVEVDFGGGHSPSTENLDSAIGSPAEQVAASTHVAESETDDDKPADPLWQDDQGHPLKEGKTYLLKAPNYAIPDRITVNKVASDHIVYTIHTDMMEYQDEMTRKEASVEGFEFVSADEEALEETPDSADGFDGHGNDVVEEHELPAHDPANVHASLSGRHEDDDERPYHANRQWLFDGDEKDELTHHLAGKDFSPTEQRRFIDEPGTARNLSKLDLSNTHYDPIDSEAQVPEAHMFLW